MDTRVNFATLKQNMVAVLSPRLLECCSNNGASMPATLKTRKRDDIFYESVLPTAPKKAWHSDQHASRDYPCLFFRHKYENAFSRDSLNPNPFSSRFRLYMATNT